MLTSVFIGLNNFFSGLIVRPQFMVGTFFALPYYITPGHYVYEGLVVSLFQNDTRFVIAEEGSEFYDAMVEDGICEQGQDEECFGPVPRYIEVFFDNEFVPENTIRNALILGMVLIMTRILSWLALKYIRYD